MLISSIILKQLVRLGLFFFEKKKVSRFFFQVSRARSYRLVGIYTMRFFFSRRRRNAPDMRLNFYNGSFLVYHDEAIYFHEWLKIICSQLYEQVYLQGFLLNANLIVAVEENLFEWNRVTRLVRIKFIDTSRRCININGKGCLGRGNGEGVKFKIIL